MSPLCFTTGHSLERLRATVLGTSKVDKFGVQTGYRPVLEQYQGGKYKIVYPKSSASVPAQLPYA